MTAAFAVMLSIVGCSLGHDSADSKVFRIRAQLVIVTGDHETGYLTGTDSDTGVWNDLVSYGAGNMPGVEWHSGDHTNPLIPFYAKGTASSMFQLIKSDKGRDKSPSLP